MKILQTIKQLLGISSEDTSFDIDITIFINTVLSTLEQLGVEEASKFPVIDSESEWDDLFRTRLTNDVDAIKSYIYFKVRLMFDPPTNSSARDAMDRVIKELEWRITNEAIVNQEQEEVSKDE